MSLISRLLDILVPPVDAPQPDDLTVVALPKDEAVGALWLGMLEDKGIHAMLRDISPLYRGYLNWAAEEEICVLYRDLDRARQILGVDTRGVLPAPTRPARRGRGAPRR